MEEKDVSVLDITEEAENAELEADDNKKLDNLKKGAQEIFINGYGFICFEYPNTELILQGDEIASKFKTKCLRNGEYLSEAQLKHIYSQPTTMKIEGKNVIIGSGEWVEKDEQEMEDLPKEIDGLWEMFVSFRKEYQDLKQKLFILTDSKENANSKKEMEEKLNKIQETAMEYYNKVLKKRARLLELQTIRIRLFSDSLEEKAFFEKLKLFIPSCIKIKKDGKFEFLWKTINDFLHDEHLSMRVVGLFNLFIRGLDIRFFGDVPEDQPL